MHSAARCANLERAARGQPPGQDDVHVCNLRLNFQRTIGDNPGTARPRDRRSPNKNESGAAPSAEGAMSLHSQWTAAS